MKMKKGQLTTTLKELIIALIAFVVLLMISFSIYNALKQSSREKISDFESLIGQIGFERNEIYVVSGQLDEDDIKKLAKFKSFIFGLNSLDEENLKKEIFQNNLNKDKLHLYIFSIDSNVLKNKYGIENFELLDQIGTIRIKLGPNKIVDFSKILGSSNGIKFDDLRSYIKGINLNSNNEIYPQLNVKPISSFQSNGLNLKKGQQNQHYLEEYNKIYIVCYANPALPNKKLNCGFVVFEKNNQDLPIPISEILKYNYKRVDEKILEKIENMGS